MPFTSLKIFDLHKRPDLNALDVLTGKNFQIIFSFYWKTLQNLHSISDGFLFLLRSSVTGFSLFCNKQVKIIPLPISETNFTTNKS